MIPQNSTDALVINLWGLQASANGTIAVVALSAIIIVMIMTKRMRWW